VIVSAGIMLQGGILALAAFSRFHANGAGRLFSLFAIGTTLVEFVLLFSMMIILVRSTGSLDLSRWNLSRGDSREEFAPTSAPLPTEAGDNSGGTGN
jgi:NADH:ubiquinone oxidoreductase subunit K